MGWDLTNVEIDKGNLWLRLQDAKSNFIKDDAELFIIFSTDFSSTSEARINDLPASTEHAYGFDNNPQDPNPHEVDVAKDNARSSNNVHWPPIAKQIVGVSLDYLYRRDGVAVLFLLSQCFLAVEKFGLGMQSTYHFVGVRGDVDRLISAFETGEPEESLLK